MERFLLCQSPPRVGSLMKQLCVSRSLCWLTRISFGLILVAGCNEGMAVDETGTVAQAVAATDSGIITSTGSGNACTITCYYSGPPYPGWYPDQSGGCPSGESCQPTTPPLLDCTSATDTQAGTCQTTPGGS